MSTKKAPKQRDAQVDAVRRKLLRAAVYVPPAIASAVLVRRASAQTPSCSPSTCTPGGPCEPSQCSPNVCSPTTCGPNRPGN